MSTVPKLTYAKVGKGSKARAESASSQLLRSSHEKTDDIFSHMNQQNLNYIKKQLKLKKNRSEHERSHSPQREQNQGIVYCDEQITNRYKLYQKYRGDEQVSEKQPHLQDTERRSDSDKRVGIILPEQLEQDYDPSDHHDSKPFLVQQQFLAASHHGTNAGKLLGKITAPENKMYHSLPYQDGKKRISSIQGYFGEAISTNLNRQEGLFIEFLEEYISDLNHSKHLKSRENEEASIQKKKNQGYSSQRKRTLSRQGEGNRNNSKLEYQLRQNNRKLQKLNRNSDTFGQRNSKFTVKGSHSPLQNQRESYINLQQSLKQEKLNTLVLAQQIQRQRKLLVVKEKIIKKLQTDKDLLAEELRHIKIQQSIINKNKASASDLDNFEGYEHKYKNIKRNDQNQLKVFELAGQITNNHHRHASINPHKTAYSYRSSMKNGDDNDLFQIFSGKPNNYDFSRQKQLHKVGISSLEKTKNEFQKFLEEERKEQIRRGRRG